MPRPLRIAIVGAGPAGIYAADALMKSEAAVEPGVSIDLFERMPAPFGLIRYGVAPDHPRIKGIITALHQVLDKPQIRLFGNVDYGTDINLDDLRSFYDAVIFSTGADGRPGARHTRASSSTARYGAADFVSWYDGHPDVPRTWPLEAEKVAVLGVGNVALDVARILAKTGRRTAADRDPAERARRPQGQQGPRGARLRPPRARRRRSSARWSCGSWTTPRTSRSSSTPRTSTTTRAPIATRRANKQADMVAKTLENWAIRDVGNRPHKLFLHFFESPTEILGEDGKVVGLRTERTAARRHRQRQGHRRVQRLGRAAVYRAVGYLSRRAAQAALGRRVGHGPGRGRPRDRETRRAPAVDLRHRLDQARPGRPHRPHQGRRQRDGREPAGRPRERPAADARRARSPRRWTSSSRTAASAYTTWDGWYRLDARGEGAGRARRAASA